MEHWFRQKWLRCYLTGLWCGNIVIHLCTHLVPFQLYTDWLDRCSSEAHTQPAHAYPYAWNVFVGELLLTDEREGFTEMEKISLKLREREISLLSKVLKDFKISAPQLNWNMPERLSSLISVTRPSKPSIVSMATRIKGQFPATSLTFKCPFATFSVVTIWSLQETNSPVCLGWFCRLEKNKNKSRLTLY